MATPTVAGPINSWLQDQDTEIFTNGHTSDRPLAVTVQLKLVHQAINHMEQQVDGRPVTIVGFSLNRNASNDLGWQATGNREFQATVGVDLPNYGTRCLHFQRGVSRKVGREKNFRDSPFGSGKRPEGLWPTFHANAPGIYGRLLRQGLL